MKHCSDLARLIDSLFQANVISYRPLRRENFICNRIFKILQQTTDAEEATQDAFLGLWKNVDALHGKPQKILPWLIRVVRNKSIDLQRKSNRRVPSSQVVQTPENTAQDSRTSESLTALDVLIDSEQSERIKNAMDQLPADQKIVIELAYFKGFSQTEIAEDLGEPLGTIKSRARYALTRLRKEMEDSHVS